MLPYYLGLDGGEVFRHPIWVHVYGLASKWHGFGQSEQSILVERDSGTCRFFILKCGICENMNFEQSTEPERKFSHCKLMYKRIIKLQPLLFRYLYVKPNSDYDRIWIKRISSCSWYIFLQLLIPDIRFKYSKYPCTWYICTFSFACQYW